MNKIKIEKVQKSGKRNAMPGAKPHPLFKAKKEKVGLKSE